ncbi:glutathione peroxidase [Azospirillum sp. Marseille-Q6669]
MPTIRDTAQSAAVMLSAVLMLSAAVPGADAADGSRAEPDALDWAALPLPAIDGGKLAPDAFRGKAVLVVNTASQCGYTGQYEGLQKLWAGRRERGLVVLGVPSNDFGGQEPGSNAQVASFCELNYGVDFPLMEKQSVTGPQAHPLYRWAAAVTGPQGVPRWNFHKILIGRDGRLLEWFGSSVTPESATLAAAVDKALASSSPTP